MAQYIHELSDWPRFRWDDRLVAALLSTARHSQGRLVGQMEALGFRVREEAVLQTLTEDVLKSSEIEGEMLDANQVRSSVARRLGIDIGGLAAADRNVEGVVDMILDATQHYDAPLTAERLFGWHASLCPTGRSGMLHFEAPVTPRIDGEMRQFLEWFNGDAAPEPVLKAALAHLWFVTIHPFDGGNGRIARAIADMSLARSERSSQRFYSMSGQIREQRAEYYRILEQTQHGTLDVTAWMEWFLDCLTRAIDGARQALATVLERTRFWEKLRDVPLNERQRLVIVKLLDGFEGNLTTSKWAALTRSSQDTALRDIQQLVDRGILVRNAAGGRSSSYALAKT